MEDKAATAAHTLEPVGSHSSIDKKEVHVGLETTQKQEGQLSMRPSLLLLLIPGQEPVFSSMESYLWLH